MTATLTTPAPAAGRLRVERLRSIADLDAIRDEWDGFVERSGSDIYFTVDWLQAWWTWYGRRRAFEGVLVRDGDAIVAALPFCAERLWAGPAPVRLARLVGCDSTLAVLAPAIAAGFEEAALGAALRVLLGDAGCDAVCLSPLSGASPAADAADRAAAAAGLPVVCSDSPGPHTVFRLPGSFDEYLAGLSGSHRRTLGRLRRRLEREHAITCRTVTGEEAAASFDRFVALHAEHWRDRGKLGHFDDWPAGEAFNRDLVARMAPTGRALFTEIADGDGRVLAMEFAFVLGERCCWRLPARDPDPALEKLRLGRISLTDLFRACIEAGVTLVEGGRGHYDYKTQLGADELGLRRVVICRASSSSRARTALLLRWSELLNFVYYRAWFLKAAPRLRRAFPRLRVLRRPLARLWTRTRM